MTVHAKPPLGLGRVERSTLGFPASGLSTGQKSLGVLIPELNCRLARVHGNCFRGLESSPFVRVCGVKRCLLGLDQSRVVGLPLFFLKFQRGTCSKNRETMIFGLVCCTSCYHSGWSAPAELIIVVLDRHAEQTQNTFTRQAVRSMGCGFETAEKMCACTRAVSEFEQLLTLGARRSD